MTEQQLEDPVFGMLTFVPSGVSRWERQEHLSLIGGNICLSVDADGDGPTEEQRRVYRTFLEAQTGLRTELQDALFEFYKTEREFYAEVNSDLEEYITECLPVLKASDEILGIIDPLSWVILGPESSVGRLSGKDACDMMLFWYGSWDMEHEFGALFKNGKLLSIESSGNF